MQILGQTEGLRAALSGETFVAYYESTPTANTVKALEAAARASYAANPLVSVLIVIDTGTPPPSPEVRKSTVEMMRRFENKTRAIAYVMRGEGFGSAAARAAVSGMLLFGRPAYPTKVFARIDAGLEWLAEQAKSGYTVEQARAIERLCAIVERRAS